MKRRKSKAKRNLQILKFREKGWTYRRIGERYTISGNRVRQICERVKHDIRWGQ